MPIYDLNTLEGITHKLSPSSKRDILGIPFIEIQEFPFDKINSEYTLIKYNNCNAKTALAEFKIGHGFMSDPWLWSYSKKPISFLKKIGRLAAWATPDFSIDMDASPAQVIGIVEQSRFIGRLGQEMGQTVFATVGWSRPELDYICFAGLRDGAIFFISTLGVKNEKCIPNFIRGYKVMRTLYPHSKIVCVGSKIEGMDDDVIHIDYEESFGYEPYQQLKLFTCISKRKENKIYGE